MTNQIKQQFLIEQKYEGFTLKAYVREVLNFSRRYTKSLKKNGGGTLLNGKVALFHHLLKEGDILTLITPKEIPSHLLIPEKMNLDIVYEDQDILVINKDSGMSSIPSKKEKTGSLTNGILEYYQAQKLPYTVHIVTRLDRQTSGLVLVAKHGQCHSVLSTMQKENVLCRKYLAIVDGELEIKKGKIDEPIGRAADSIIKRVVRKDGQPAITYYEVIKEKRNLSLIKIYLETGRTHQIRVHFNLIGHPLIGDTLYGNAHQNIKRQALHCEQLKFVHPFSRKNMVFKVDIPNDMKKLI